MIPGGRKPGDFAIKLRNALFLVKLCAQINSFLLIYFLISFNPQGLSVVSLFVLEAQKFLQAPTNQAYLMGKRTMSAFFLAEASLFRYVAVPLLQCSKGLV
jgi:uncharacterized membrane protein